MKEPWKYCSLVIIREVSPDSSEVREFNVLYHGMYYVYRYYNDVAWRSEFLKHYRYELSIKGSNVFRLV